MHATASRTAVARRAVAPIVFRLTALTVAALVVLTAADIVLTRIFLANGAIELNTFARDGLGGIDIGFLVVSNFMVLMPLSVVFYLGVREADRVPPTVLGRWWRHMFDMFTVHPRSVNGKARAPLRLVTAAATMLVFKVLVVLNNILVVFGAPNPATFAVGLFSGAGLDDAALWHASYAVMIVPCYMAAVGFAALTLKAVQARSR